MRLLHRKLEKIENALKPARRSWYLWRELGETIQEAKARHMTEHPEAKPTDEFVIISWREETEPEKCGD